MESDSPIKYKDFGLDQGGRASVDFIYKAAGLLWKKKDGYVRRDIPYPDHLSASSSLILAKWTPGSAIEAMSTFNCFLAVLVA
jgi:hypothetical protein